MAAITTAVAAASEGEFQLAGFGADGPDLNWRVVNDNVMGGRSDGDYIIDNDTLILTGSTNTRGGGFSSIRAESLELNLEAFDGIRVRVKGDGRRYTWRLASTRRWRGIGVGYWAEFDTLVGEWMVVDLPFSSFVPQVRGQRLQGPKIDRASITGMGLMIYDGQDGPFAIELKSVFAYAAASLSLRDYRWKSRVLVLAAPDSEDELFKAQLRALEATRVQFNERDMTLLIVHDDDESAEANELREQLELKTGEFSLTLVGKDGGVKRTERSPVNMQDIYSLIDTMPMRRQEMRTEDDS